MEGRWVFARFWVLPRPNSKKRFSRTFLMEFLDVRRRDVWTVHSHLSCFGISASSVVYKLREFSSNQPSLHLLYFSTYSGINNSLPYPKHMLRAHYISMSLAIVRMGVWLIVAGRGSRVAGPKSRSRVQCRGRGSKVAVAGPMSGQGKMIWGSRSEWKRLIWTQYKGILHGTLR